MENLASFMPLFNGGKPLGATFETNRKKYFYDTSTGKILECGIVEHEILKKIVEEKWEELLDLIHVYDKQEIENASNNIHKFIENGNIFKIKKFKKFHIPEDYDSAILNSLDQITLELTERCNLRCGYCIYNEGCDKNRDFGSKDMADDTAIKAIDYAAEHSKDSNEIAITFYGGEPLIRYDLMKKCINYSKDKIKDRKLSYSFTTNCTLITEEIAQELAQHENMSIACSLDGPEDVHDSYRKNINGSGSFKSTLRGLRYLVDAFGERAKKEIMLSMVYAPPYSSLKLQKIQLFFDELNWLPKEMLKLVSYPSDNDHAYIEKYIIKNNIQIDVPKNEINTNTLLDWSKTNYKNEASFSRTTLNEYFSRIYRRPILSEPTDVIARNGCCLPGQRRLYVTVDGNFKICERVGEIPEIGHIDDGVNLVEIYNTYLQGYTKKSIDKCSTCWLARLCNLCFIQSYNKDGFDIEKKEINCGKAMNSFLRAFSFYFDELENDPKCFDRFDEIKVN